MRKRARRAIGPGHARHRAVRAGTGRAHVQPRADALCQTQPVARRFGHRKAVVFAVTRQMRGAARGVLRKPARRQNDTTPRHDPAAIGQFHPRHPPVLADQPRHLRPGAQIDLQVQRRPQQPRHQSRAIAQVHPAAVPHQIAAMAQCADRDMAQRRHRPRHGHERAQVGPGLNGHAMKRRFAQRWAQQRHRRPQPARIIGPRDHRPPAKSRAGRIAIGVGDGETAVELQRGVLREEIHHLRCRRQKRVDTRGVEPVAQHRQQVIARRCRRGIHRLPQRLSQSISQRISGRPDPATRPCRSAAQHGGAVQNGDRQPVMRRRHRRRQPGRAGPHHDQIAPVSHASPLVAASRSCD